jgi:hypothetical protein
MSVCCVYRCLSVVGCITFIAAFALAQPAPKPPAKPALPKPNPIVTITKLDKTVVRGQLISAEPDQLIVKASGAAGEPVTVRWSQIAKVSNGLTQEQATEQWKAQHTPEQLCPDCRGNRGIACKDCHGTGHDPAKLVDCKDCGAAGCCSARTKSATRAKSTARCLASSSPRAAGSTRMERRFGCSAAARGSVQDTLAKCGK